MTPGLELRSLTLELRATDDKKISGYGAVFNSTYDCGDFVETIRGGAFSDVLNDDVVCLFNHNPNNLLGRTSSGTMYISQDAKGLRYECQLDDTSIANEVYGMVKRGDLKGSSFSFIVGEEKWTRGQREILSFKSVHDVGPVTFPAYEETSVAARNRGRQFRTTGRLLQAVDLRPTDDLEADRERLRLLLEVTRCRY